MTATDTSAEPTAFADSTQWFDALVRAMYGLIHHFETDNFDAERFGRESQPNAFYAERHAAYLSFLIRHYDDFFASRRLLWDVISRNLFDQLLLFRLLGHLHVRLPFNTPEATNYHAVVDQWKVGDTEDGGMFGPLSIFAVPFDDGPMRLKCWGGNVAASFLFRQYFYDRDGVAIGPRPGDHVIDAGGCFGDTALAFAKEVGENGHVHTFDPLKRHCAIMRDSFAMNPDLAKRISIHEVGLANVDDRGSASHERDMAIDPGARVAVGGDLPMRTIDSLVAKREIERVDFIKMDVEGSELQALTGAETSLRKWRPKLAISLYHRPEDFFSIPLWINSLGCGYRFHLDHYSIHSEETVLYAAQPARANS